MSRQHLRHEKNCLNCGSPVHDKYCSHCGQLNTEPHQSFGHLLGHFLSDITHYDSQFLTTIKDLVFRPGFLTREYAAGKRASYLDPIKMYIFISAVFFLVMASQSSDENKQPANVSPAAVINPYRQHLADSLRAQIKHGANPSYTDSAKNGVYALLAATLDTPKTAVKDTSESIGAHFNDHGVFSFSFSEHKYASIRQYDSVQRARPAPARDGWIAAYTNRKLTRLTHANGHYGDVEMDQNIEHDIPKIMFLLLPLFAFFIGLFYNRKKYFYSQHFVFSLHFHSFVFILLLVDWLLSLFVNLDKAIVYMVAGTVLVIFVYLVAGLRRSYAQSFWLSLVKGAAISMIYLVVTLIGICIALTAAFILI